MSSLFDLFVIDFSYFNGYDHTHFYAYFYHFSHFLKRDFLASIN